MNRRDLIALALPGVALLLLATAPALAQQSPAKARLGWLARGELTADPGIFDRELARLGWVEGENLVSDRRFADSSQAYSRAAADLVASRPDALVGVGSADVEALFAVTRTIPIVFIVVGDPVALGFAESLARPGGNVTGTSSMAPELELKQLELVRDLLPGARRVAMLRDPRNPGTEERLAADQAAAPSVSLMLIKRQFGSGADIDAAFAAASADHDDAVHVEVSGGTLSERERIVGLASRYRLPAVYGVRAFAEAGGLMSYGPLYSENFRRAAVLVDKILRGAQPRDLPVEQPTRFELVVNLKTAKSLDLRVPPSILARADEVIE